MAKETEAKQEQPVAVEPAKQEAEVEEVKPIEKPQVTREEYEQLRTELQAMDGRWKGAQGIISKQKEEMENLKDNQELWKVLIGMRAQEMGVSEAQAEEDLQKKKPDLMQQYNIAQQNLESRRRQTKINSYKSIVEEELGLKEEDDDYEVIQSLVLKGKFDKADKRIATIKANKIEQPKSKEGQVGTEDERIERLADEKFKAKMIEKGLLTAEGAEPSAGTTDATWYKDQWCTGEAPATPANLERAQKFMDKGE